MRSNMVSSGVHGPAGIKNHQAEQAEAEREVNDIEHGPLLMQLERARRAGIRCRCGRSGAGIKAA
jgi:hypothetical protein